MIKIIKNRLKFIIELLLSFYQGASISSLFFEILIRLSNVPKTRKKTLIKSIKSYQPLFYKFDEFMKLNHFSENLKNEIEENIKVDRRTVIFLKHLMLYHLWFGSFVNCQYLRNLYRIKLICFQQKQHTLDFNAARAALEANRLYILKTWLKKKKISKFDNNLLKVFLDHLKISSHEKSPHLELSKSSMVNLVQNKKIIVIGPAPDDKVHSLEKLNKYDLSIGANYVSDISAKTNISYYSGFIKKAGSDTVINSLKDLDIACIQSQYFKLLRLNPIQYLKVRIFEADSISIMLMFKSEPNLIQNIIFDLLKFNPNKIYLCGINFYTSKETYRNRSYTNFHSNEKKKKPILETIRIVHDLFANFIFLKNIWMNGLMEVSENVEKVISLTELEYAEKLDNLSRTNIEY